MSDGTIADLPLRKAARQRYLNYAISVITSRALPDVRDGLKPVQRRILYAMYKDLRLLPDRRELKCAKVVGEVLGNYHPHGDSAVYDAMVRMAQDWSLRYPLVNGHGNFGSIDGDRPAAYRYTEAKLRPFAVPLLDEIDQDTVDFRPTFDAVREEPIVLPSKLPMLLLNGATGIAVGIATNIPPHNLGEITKACIKLIDAPDTTVGMLMRTVKGPDFPTGGVILNSSEELRKIYETGSGPVRVRGEHTIEGKGRKARIVITSIPYMIKKLDLVERIRELALDKKVPQITDVRDESTSDIRIVLDIKAEADPDKILAFLYKSTDLQSNFNVNLTCLVPVPGTEIAAPMSLDLKEFLRYFLDFRFETVRRRYEYELRMLLERIHILDGFAKIFNDLDTAIRIIRESKDKKDAGEGLMSYFLIDEIQSTAILETMLYRLASLEIKKILQERREKRTRAEEIRVILGSDKRLWTQVRDELSEAAAMFIDDRRSKVGGKVEETTVEVSADDFIVDEAQYVVLSAAGWVKRVGSIRSLDKVPVKQGDSLVGVIAGGTRSTVVFFSSLGVAYTARINDITASRGYGDPIQKMFKMKDGERVVAMFSLDPRVIGNIKSPGEAYCPPVHGLAVGSSGHALRFGLETFAEPSTRVGRKFARPPKGAEILNVFPIDGEELLVVASRQARILICKADEVNFLENAGKGVYALRCGAEDELVGAVVTHKEHEGLTAVTNSDATHNINARRYKVTGRGGKGHQVMRRGSFVEIRTPDLTLPELPE